MRRSHPPALRQGRFRAGRSPTSSGGGPAGHGGKAPLTRRGLTQGVVRTSRSGSDGDRAGDRSSRTQPRCRSATCARSPRRSRAESHGRPDDIAGLLGREPWPVGRKPDRRSCGCHMRCGAERMAGDTSRYADACPKVKRCDTATDVMTIEVVSTAWTTAPLLRHVLGRRRPTAQRREKGTRTVSARIADAASAVTSGATSSRKTMFG